MALTTANVYVEPGIKGIDTQVLEQAASQGQGDPHTPVKIAILSSLPAVYLGNIRHAEAQNAQLQETVGKNVRAYYAFELHKALGLDKEPLVLVVLQGQNPGVSVWTTALSASDCRQLANQYAQAIKNKSAGGNGPACPNSRVPYQCKGIWRPVNDPMDCVFSLSSSALRR